MHHFKSPFNPWTLPTRCFAALIMAYGFSRILMSADAAGIVIAVVGSLVWQVGTALEERSSLFRRLDKTPVGSIMRIDRLPVPSWWTLAKVRKQFATFGKLRFLVTMHDGYASGVALPQQVLAINEREAPFVPIGVLAQPISRVNAVRENDALLEAFTKMRRLRADWVPVLSSQENLIGIVTMDDILQQVEGNRPDLQETGQHDSDRVPVAA